MSTAPRWVVTWAYAVEFLLAFAATAALTVWFGSATLISFHSQNIGIVVACIGIFLATSAGLFAVTANLFSSQFGTWLRFQKADTIFLSASKYSLIVQLLALVALLVTWSSEGAVAAVLATFVSVYATVVFLTTIGTTFNLVTMSLTFRELLRQEETKSHVNEPSEEEHGDG